MRIDQKTVDDVTILAFEGEWDAANLPDSKGRLAAVLDSGARNLVFNLRELRFINSSALGYVFEFREQLNALDGEIVIAEPSDFFQRTITALGIEYLFDIYDGDAEAVAHFGA